MSAAHPDNWIPSRELLAAYADGELDWRPHLAGQRRQIEAWLAHHPEAAAELEAQMEVGRLWSATTPPEPAPAAWAKVWQRVAAVPGPAKARRWPAALWLVGLAVTGAAAAVLALLFLDRQETPAPQAPPQRQARRVGVPVHPVPAPAVGDDDKEGQDPDAGVLVSAPARSARYATAACRWRRGHESGVEPLPVAGPDEIEIVRIAGSDVGTVVAGRMPVTSPMVLIQAAEFQVKPPVNGEPGVAVRTVGTSPMAWPLLRNDDDD
jgi:hypothetical protein